MNDFNEPGTLAPTGLYLGGTKYMVIQGEPGAVIRGKKVKTVVYRRYLLEFWLHKFIAQGTNDPLISDEWWCSFCQDIDLTFLHSLKLKTKLKVCCNHIIVGSTS